MEGVTSDASMAAARQQAAELAARALACRDQAPHDADAFAACAAEHAQQCGDGATLAQMLVLRGSLAQTEARYEDALRLLTHALDVLGVLADQPARAEALRAIGRVYDDLGDFARALDYYLQALGIDERTGNDASRAASLRTIGVVYSKSGDARQGLSFYQQSLALCRRTGDLDSSARTLNNMGINFKNLGELEAAKGALDEAYALFSQAGNRFGQASSLSNLGLVYEALGRDDEAIAAMSQAKGLAADMSYALAEIKVYLGLGKLYTRLGRHALALTELTAALERAQRIASLPEQLLANEALAALYKRMGDFEQALDHFERHHALERQLFSEESDRKLRAMQVRYALAQAQRETELMRLRQEELAQANAELQALNRSLVQSDATKTQLLTQLERLSQEDALTGLFNRRYLDAFLADAFARARRDGQALAVALGDIDFFKQVNDRCSHAVGDIVLKTVARLLRDNCRAADVVARYGGEEFAIIFPATDAAGAATVCEKMRAAIERQDWKAIHPQLVVTMSIGVSDDLRVPHHEKLLALADDHLYQAKYGGKNQVRWR